MGEKKKPELPQSSSSPDFLVEAWVRGAWEPGPFSVKLGGYTKGARGTLLSGLPGEMGCC